MQLTMENIHKNYGKKQVLKGISFEMENGVYGLLGPNGAGKTTLIRIMAGVMNATSGKILMQGKDRKDCDLAFRRKLGYLPQDINFYPNFTGKQYLQYVAAIKGLDNAAADGKIKQLAYQVGLQEDLDRKCVNYFGGMKRRLGIAQALLNDPEILILDEPTAGLDPYEWIKFRNIISFFSQDRTVLLSTHIVTDIDSIAKKIIMIKDGKVKKMESSDNYIRDMQRKVWSVSKTPEEMIAFQQKHIISNMIPKDNMIIARVLSDNPPVADAVALEPNLEDAYLYEFNYMGGVHK